MAELSEFKARRHREQEVDYFYSAIVFSLILHLVLLLLWDLNRRHRYLHPDLFNFLHKVDPSRMLMKPEPPKPVVQRQVIFRFADVSPDQPEVEPPKDARLYGVKSTRAANEKPPAKKSEKARIEGSQKDMIRVKDQPVPQTPAAPKPKPAPPEPKPDSPKPPESKPKRKPPKPKPVPPKPVEKPKPAPPKPKVVKVAAVQPPPKPAQPPEPPRPEPKPPAPKVDQLRMTPPPPKPKSRPRTLKEARERRAAALGLVGRKMNQDGGVENLGRASLDVLGTSFGAYDRELSLAIQARWFQLMENRRPLPRGRVVIRFRLLHTGRVVNVETLSSSVDDLHTAICQMAVKDPSPYPRWPVEMRRQLQNDYRDITVSFTY